MTKALDKIKKFNEDQSEKNTAKESATTKSENDKTNKEKIQEKGKEPTAEELALQEQLAKEQEEKDRLDAIHQTTEAVGTLVDRVNARVEPVKNWISTRPTPGGILALVIAILLFALIVLPVDAQGHTRLFLFYQSLIGRTHMKYSEGQNNAANVTTGGQAGASFGGTGGSDNGVATIDMSHLNLFNMFPS